MLESYTQDNLQFMFFLFFFSCRRDLQSCIGNCNWRLKTQDNIGDLVLCWFCTLYAEARCKCIFM